MPVLKFNQKDSLRSLKLRADQGDKRAQAKLKRFSEKVTKTFQELARHFDS